jgi:hypothetical protein
MQKAEGRIATLLISACCLLPTAFAAEAAWTAHPSDGVEMHLRSEGDVNRVDFDFHGHGGYAIARRAVDLELPANYQFVFRVRGDAPPENLEFKLIRGDDVWWLNRRDFAFPRAWTTLKTKKRQIGFAWGPNGGGDAKHIDSMEVVVTAGSGGKGTVWFSDPELEPLPVVSNEPIHFTTSMIHWRTGAPACPPSTRDRRGACHPVGGTVDLGENREVGGLIIDCVGHTCGVIGTGGRASHEYVGNRVFVWLPDTEARTLHINGKVKEVIVEPPTWAPTKNDFYSIVAKAARRGDYPRYFVGEQPYWTVIGADGAENEALVGEDGNVEPFKGGDSIEPFLIVNGKRLTWADVTITQSLAYGYLPIPSVTWKARDASMTMTAAVSSSSMLQLRYRLRVGVAPPPSAAQDIRRRGRQRPAETKAILELKVRPFQVNPSTQFLNTEGGVARMHNPALAHVARRVAAEGGGATFEIDIPLAKGAKRESFEKIASDWREKLNRVAIEIAGAPEIANTIRTSLAYMLIHRDGPALEPGSRSYDRAWIRDGSLMAAILLRLGHAREAKEFAEWFAKYQYENGKVPCCVDKRGADPVPENDSHGEFIYLVHEVFRLTHDEDFMRRMRPHVEAAVRYINELRAQNHGEFEGLVTESISHEGYSAKPVHSYWDDVFCLRGLDDAGDPHAAEFRRDLIASMQRTMAEHHLDTIPASAELGDFDPTSTAISISPLGLTSLMPRAALERTYDEYLNSIAKRRNDYTPYEMRIIGALIRLGDRNRALQLVDRFMLDRRPAAWNEWAEVVRTEYRKPGFIGDMPHAWVASDFVRSILDAIVYEREDGTLAIGTGVPRRWLPVHIGPLPTSSGVVDIRIGKDGVVKLSRNPGQ